MAMRTISKEHLQQLAGSGKMIFTESGEIFSPSQNVSPVTGVEPEQVPPPIPAPLAPPVVTPVVHVAPTEVIMRPEIVVQAPAVTVNAPDMQPIATALHTLQNSIMESIGAIQIPAPVVNVPAPVVTANMESPPPPAVHVQVDMASVAYAVQSVATAIANRPTTASWRFTVTRDHAGAIEEVTAIKTEG